METKTEDGVEYCINCGMRWDVIFRDEDSSIPIIDCLYCNDSSCIT